MNSTLHKFLTSFSYLNSFLITRFSIFLERHVPTQPYILDIYILNLTAVVMFQKRNFVAIFVIFIKHFFAFLLISVKNT